MPQIEVLIKGCKKKDPASQEAVYMQFSAKMMGVAVRYCESREEAEDIVHEAFFKVFTKIEDYTEKGSFEGWIRRIVVSTAIDAYRKKKRESQLYAEVALEGQDIAEGDVIEEMSAGELLNILNEIPEAYRVILNLYSVEGYSHKEIGEMLGISEGNSRARLARAKKVLESKLNRNFSPAVAI